MFFNTILKHKVRKAREKLHGRLDTINGLLSESGLDDTLRGKLEAEKKKILEHLQTRIRKINGGPQE